MRYKFDPDDTTLRLAGIMRGTRSGIVMHDALDGRRTSCRAL